MLNLSRFQLQAIIRSIEFSEKLSGTNRIATLQSRAGAPARSDTDVPSQRLKGGPRSPGAELLISAVSIRFPPSPTATGRRTCR